MACIRRCCRLFSLCNARAKAVHGKTLSVDSVETYTRSGGARSRHAGRSRSLQQLMSVRHERRTTTPNKLQKPTFHAVNLMTQTADCSQRKLHSVDQTGATCAHDDTKPQPVGRVPKVLEKRVNTFAKSTVHWMSCLGVKKRDD